MAKLKIYTLPNKILRQNSLDVTDVSSLGKEIKDMIETLEVLPGYGLAAPQVGISKKIIVIQFGGTFDDEGNVLEAPIPLLVLINPKITKFSSEKCSFEEACFSVPDFRASIERPKKIRVEALDQNGKKININASGLLARVLQHEIDHLNGILFIDYVKDKKDLIPNKPDENWQKMIAN